MHGSAYVLHSGSDQSFNSLKIGLTKTPNRRVFLEDEALDTKQYASSLSLTPVTFPVLLYLSPIPLS